jgi:hypothetical protein
MMTDAPADAAAPEFDLGDEFWETSTVATRSLADGENSISDNSMDDRKRGTKDDTAWLDDLPF